jgi:hypothetical protein
MRIIDLTEEHLPRFLCCLADASRRTEDRGDRCFRSAGLHGSFRFQYLYTSPPKFDT